MNAGDSIQLFVGIVLAGTLGAVLWYACEARKQAGASLKMAEEMRRTREDSLRPVVDIQRIEQEEFGRGPEAMTEAMAERTGDHHIWCKLKNIGNGPALNVNAHLAQGGTGAEGPLGTLGVGDETDPKPLAVIKPEDSFVEVRYQSVYGRLFWSRRPATFDQAGPHLGRLETGEE
jgi:hypothetical protein